MNVPIIAYRRPQQVGSETSKASLKAVHDLFDGIACEAVGMATP